jgi:hypothetical protein
MESKFLDNQGNTPSASFNVPFKDDRGIDCVVIIDEFDPPIDYRASKMFTRITMQETVSETVLFVEAYPNYLTPQKKDEAFANITANPKKFRELK